MLQQHKKLFTPLYCIVGGILHYLILLMNFVSVFMTAGSEFFSEGFNGYAFFDLASHLGEAASEIPSDVFGDKWYITLYFVVALVLLIVSTVTAGILIPIGTVRLIEALSGMNITPFLQAKTASFITRIVTIVYGISACFAASYASTFCGLSVQTGRIFGTSFSFGFMPSFGLFLLYLLPPAGLILSILADRKPARILTKLVCECPSCGTPANRDDAFCISCGSPITHELTSTEEPDADPEVKQFDYGSIVAKAKQNTKMLKKIGFFAGVGVAAVLLIWLVIALLPKSTIVVRAESDCFVRYDSEEQESVIVQNGTLTKIRFDGTVYSSQQSLDGSTLVFESSENTLYAYYKNKLIDIEDNVSDFRLASDGTAVAYIDEDGDLILFSLDKKKGTTITDELYDTCYALSPDGKSVAYLISDGNNVTLFTSVNGKSTEIGEGLYPIGLSNGAKLLYYYDAEKDALYAKKGKDSLKLASDTDTSFVFNADHTQILFSSDYKYYISDNGKEKVKVSSSSISQLGYTENTVTDSIFGFYSVTSAIKSYKKQYFISGDTLYYLDSKLEAHKIASSVSSFQTTDTGEKIYYRNTSGELYCGKYGAKEKSKFKKFAEDVYRYRITSDGKKCYYIDYDDTLRFAKKAGKSEKIADDITSFYLTHDDYAFFLTDDDTLYESHNGKKKNRVADEVTEVIRTETAVYYECLNDDYDLGYIDFYGAKKAAKFKLLMEETNG